MISSISAKTEMLVPIRSGDIRDALLPAEHLSKQSRSCLSALEADTLSNE